MPLRRRLESAALNRFLHQLGLRFEWPKTVYPCAAQGRPLLAVCFDLAAQSFGTTRALRLDHRLRQTAQRLGRYPVSPATVLLPCE